nr:D(1)-like dopamine receptor [Ipomoea batatas]
MAKSATKVWGGSPSGSWGKSVLDGWGGSPSGSWGKSTTDGWGGSPSGSLEKSAAKGWGGSASRSWGKPAVDLWGESKVVGSKGWGGGSASQSWGKPAVDLWGESKAVGTKGWGEGSSSRNWEKPAVDLWGGSRKSEHKPVSKKRKWSSGESQERTSTGWSGATSSVNGCAGSQQTTSYNLKKKFNNWRSGGWDGSSDVAESDWIVLSLFFWIKSIMSSFVLLPSYCNRLPDADLKYRVGYPITLNFPFGISFALPS